DVDGIRIPRVDYDTRDVLGLFEADVLPGASGVLALVDAVPVRDAPLVIVLTRADPNDGRVLRVDRDRADRVGALAIEHWRPRRAVVVRQPDSAGGLRDEVVAGAVRKHRDLRDPSGDEHRADISGTQSGKCRGVDRFV